MILSSVAGLNIDPAKKEIAKKIFSDFCYGHYNPIKVKLIPEPDNKFDSKAIKVMYENQQIGYIPKKDQCLIPLQRFKQESDAMAWDVGYNREKDFYWCHLQLEE